MEEGFLYFYAITGDFCLGALSFGVLYAEFHAELFVELVSVCFSLADHERLVLAFAIFFKFLLVLLVCLYLPLLLAQPVILACNRLDRQFRGLKTLFLRVLNNLVSRTRRIIGIGHTPELLFLSFYLRN